VRSHWRRWSRANNAALGSNHQLDRTPLKLVIAGLFRVLMVPHRSAKKIEFRLSRFTRGRNGTVAVRLS
jgi:hypothetical protein